MILFDRYGACTYTRWWNASRAKQILPPRRQMCAAMIVGCGAIRNFIQKVKIEKICVRDSGGGNGASTLFHH